MKRREFIHKSVISSIGITVAGLRPGYAGYFSKVIISRDSSMIDSKFVIDSGKVSNSLDRAMTTLYSVKDPISAWKKVVKPKEVIGIKTNCLSGRGSTNQVLVDLIVERLHQVGIRRQNIIIWDRYNMDLEDAGYTIKTDGPGPFCYGNDHAGFEYNLEVYGSAGSRVTKIMTQFCDGIINLPVLKDHSIAGVTIALKNMFGAIHNPNKYHLNNGDPYIADVNALPSVRNKTRLHICDAIEGQYQGGPSFMPQWRWPFGGLIVSQDPVALDTVGWQIIEEKRQVMGMKSLIDDKRKPTYIGTASDSDHRLGISDPRRIEVVKV